MKRKYDNPKVKVGDWVYFLSNCRDETKYSYKVVRVERPDLIIVEVNENKKDAFVLGWKERTIGDGHYWNVTTWYLGHRHCYNMEIE